MCNDDFKPLFLASISLWNTELEFVIYLFLPSCFPQYTPLPVIIWFTYPTMHCLSPPLGGMPHGGRGPCCAAYRLTWAGRGTLGAER